MTQPETGRTGYNSRGGPPARTMEAMEQFPAEHSEAVTAAALMTRFDAGGADRTDPWVIKGADLLSRKPPIWPVESGTIDMYYWYWGTRALSRVGGDRWNRWSHALTRALLDSQADAAGRDEIGSWEPAGAWGQHGGRVYATAISCLMLQEVRRHASGN
jgi:hypothetical protein